MKLRHDVDRLVVLTHFAQRRRHALPSVIRAKTVDAAIRAKRTGVVVAGHDLPSRQAVPVKRTCRDRLAWILATQRFGRAPTMN